MKLFNFIISFALIHQAFSAATYHEGRQLNIKIKYTLLNLFYFHLKKAILVVLLEVTAMTYYTMVYHWNWLLP
jgi:hypothetical protein